MQTKEEFIRQFIIDKLAKLECKSITCRLEGDYKGANAINYARMILVELANEADLNIPDKSWDSRINSYQP